VLDPSSNDNFGHTWWAIKPTIRQLQSNFMRISCRCCHYALRKDKEVFMKHGIGLSGIILVALLFSNIPLKGQDQTGSQQYLPWVANAPLVQSAQAAGLNLKVTKFTDSADGVCDADCSLREAITVANQTPGADTITLSPGIYQLTIPPELDNYGAPLEDENNAIGDLDIADDLTLVGAGAETTTIESAMPQRVFKVLAGAKTQFRHFTITGGGTTSDEEGGGLFNAGDLTLQNVHIVGIQIGNSDAATGNGGGIYNVGTLALTDTKVVNNSAYNSGGGIFNTGHLTMKNVQVTGNSSGGYDGGGRGGGIYNTSNLTIYTSQITRNAASSFGAAAGSGGGIANNGILKLYDSLIQDNYASGGESRTQGGGISNEGDALLSGSTVASNTAELGGGIASSGGKVNVVNSTISIDILPRINSRDSRVKHGKP